MAIIEIANLVDLQLIYDDGPDWSDNTYVLTADIDASATQVSTYGTATDTSGVGNILNTGGEGFLPIGDDTNGFNTAFDGAGFVISGLTISRPSTSCIGMFGATEEATLSDVRCELFDIEGSRGVGCIAGECDDTTISGCYSEGTVSGIAKVGGLVGECGGTTISGCYSSASVSGLDAVGGLVGETDSAVSDSYATGAVTGTGEIAGGLIGECDGAVTNCYSVGAVVGVDDVGGLIGDDNEQVYTNCFWDTQTSGQASSAGGTGKTTAEMETQSTFTNWDFDDIWIMDGYPELQVFYIPPPSDANNNDAFAGTLNDAFAGTLNDAFNATTEINDQFGGDRNNQFNE